MPAGQIPKETAHPPQRLEHGTAPSMEQEPASPAPSGVSLGPGPTPLGGLQLAISVVLLEMQQASEASAGPTHALNCRVSCKAVMAD